MNTCSQWHVGRSGHDLFFLFLFFISLSLLLSSPFIPYQALPMLTFKFWFILNTIAHLANSFPFQISIYSLHHWFILIFIQKVYLVTYICHTIYMYLRHKDYLPFHRCLFSVLCWHFLSVVVFNVSLLMMSIIASLACSHF